ncbi:ATP-binding protein [Frigidibacter oleivorans]|uniref:ATP-binding protein n=1 Tax=Frigidibacter oleivorans TaxID=2487129 RepID=UPI002E26A77D
MNSDLVSSLLAGVPLPLMIVGPDERIRSTNAAAQRLFGEGIEGRAVLTVIRQPALLDAMEATLRDGQVNRARFLVTGTQDTIYRVTASPVQSEQAHGALLAFEDVTDLEKAEEMRRDFVANVSHELRTPLTALLGFIETLKGAARDDAAARERFLTIMEREAGRMNRLVRDLLSLSRVEAEERMRPGERIDMSAVVRGAIAALKPVAEAAKVEIELTGADQPILLLADPDQMMQVFSNLIENAVKYGGGGRHVTVAIAREPREIGLRGPAVRFEVIDRGEGIEAVHLPRLTERFYRVDAHRSREKGGTGLGLAIVKHIVNRHRGRLKIESEKGKGSKFTVLLPEN